MGAKSSLGVLVKDGAMGTLLESWNVKYDNTNLLWSSSVLLSDISLVERAHKAYIDAGCDVLLTCTYQMFEEGCKKFNVTLPELVDLAIDVARRTMPPRKGKVDSNEHVDFADTFSSVQSSTREGGSERVVLLAGSLGPYGSSLPSGMEYSGDYTVNDSIIQTFHGGRLEAFVGQENGKKFLKVDFLLLETFPRLDEALGIISWMRQHDVLRTSPVCFSFVAAPVKSFLQEGADNRELDAWWNSAAASVRLPDGNSFEAALAALRGNCTSAWTGVGCNCSSPLEAALVATAWLQKKREKGERPLVLLMCPNSGERFEDNEWRNMPQAEQTASTGEGGAKSSGRDSQRRLAQGCGLVVTCVKFVLHLLRERPTADDWLFEVVICGGCCRSTPEDICSLKRITNEEQRSFKSNEEKNLNE